MHLVALKTAIGIQVHHEEQIASLEGQDFVHPIANGHEFVFRAEPFEAILQGLHQFIEVLEILVAQGLIISQIPPSATEMMAPSILRTREIDPLWMAELIAHEVQITCTSKRERNMKQLQNLLATSRNVETPRETP